MKKKILPSQINTISAEKIEFCKWLHKHLGTKDDFPSNMHTG